MSLTDRIKTESAKEYQASDGTIYLLQRVSSTALLMDSGALPDLLKGDTKALKEAAGDSEKAGAELLAEMAAKDPEGAARMFEFGVRNKTAKLRAGLIGERNPLMPSGAMIYRWVDKPAVLLEAGEVNAELIPSELADELVEQIDLLGAPPATPEVTTRFPQE